MRRPRREDAVVTWPLFWVTLALAMVANLFDRSNVDSPADVAVNALLVLVSVLVMFAVMWVLEPLVMRDPSSRRTVRAFTLIALGALARAPVLSALLAATGISDARWAFRGLSALLLYAPALTIAASVITLLRQSAARRARFAADYARLSQEQQDARARTDAFRDRALEGIRALLSERLTALREGRSGDLGTQLRADVDGVIRPLSHRMAGRGVDDAAQRSAAGAPRIRWADVWHAGLLGRPIRPGPTAGLVALMVLVGLSWYAGTVAWGLATVLATAVLVFVVLHGLRRALQRPLRALPPAWRAVAFTVSIATGMLVPAVAMGVMLTASGSTAPWRVPITFALAAPVVVWLVAMDQGLRQQVVAADSEMAARTAQLHHAAASARSLAHHEERRLSRALHGPVQAAVTSAAMRMDAGDVAGAEQLLMDAIGHLDTGSDDGRGVVRALDDIAAAWDGLCSVQVDMDLDAEEAIDQDPPLAASVIDICTEACSNAVRHGDAEQIVVVARRSRDAIDLTVRDDGAPGEATARPGLGSATLDDVTLHWERRREGGSTVLRATLPCR